VRFTNEKLSVPVPNGNVELAAPGVYVVPVVSTPEGPGLRAGMGVNPPYEVVARGWRVCAPYAPKYTYDVVSVGIGNPFGQMSTKGGHIIPLNRAGCNVSHTASIVTGLVG
jgi:hypothetical protein